MGWDFLFQKTLLKKCQKYECVYFITTITSSALLECNHRSHGFVTKVALWQTHRSILSFGFITGHYVLWFSKTS